MHHTAMTICRRTLLQGLVAVAAVMPASGAEVHGTADPMPSWQDGNVKRSIIGFVQRVISPGASFVPPGQRIAVFDNDGTLWAEKPIYFQLAYALDEVKRLAPSHPEWRDKEPFRSILAERPAALSAFGESGLLQIVAATHSGMTTDEYAANVAKWIATARHPTLHRPYTDLVYQPMLELLSYLRANGFKTFIVSGGGIEFMRVFAERVYGVPPEQVVGSSGVVRFQKAADGQPELVKEPKVEFIDDGPGKPVGINRFIGRRPILAFGNSDGDQQMLEWTVAGSGPRFAALIHHTDDKREWAYDRKSAVGKLDKALDEAMARGWTVVDMKTDWKVIFPGGS